VYVRKLCVLSPADDSAQYLWSGAPLVCVWRCNVARGVTNRPKRTPMNIIAHTYYHRWQRSSPHEDRYSDPDPDPTDSRTKALECERARQGAAIHEAHGAEEIVEGAGAEQLQRRAKVGRPAWTSQASDAPQLQVRDKNRREGSSQRSQVACCVRTRRSPRALPRAAGGAGR
jgi:hypothetical protein